MIKASIISALGLSLSLSFSSSLIAREAVIKTFKVTTTDTESEMNGSEASVRVHMEGTVETSKTGCEATRALASLSLNETEVAGKIQTVISATVSPRFIARSLPCEKVLPGFEDLRFETAYVMGRDQLDEILVLNVESEGKNILLSELIKMSEDAGSESPPVETELTECPSRPVGPVVCPMNFAPSVCTYGTIKVEGGNQCQAYSALQAAICRKQKAYDATEISCHSGVSM